MVCRDAWCWLGVDCETKMRRSETKGELRWNEEMSLLRPIYAAGGEGSGSRSSTSE